MLVMQTTLKNETDIKPAVRVYSKMFKFYCWLNIILLVFFLIIPGVSLYMEHLGGRQLPELAFGIMTLGLFVLPFTFCALVLRASADFKKVSSDPTVKVESPVLTYYGDITIVERMHATVRKCILPFGLASIVSYICMLLGGDSMMWMTVIFYPTFVIAGTGAIALAMSMLVSYYFWDDAADELDYHLSAQILLGSVTVALLLPPAIAALSDPQFWFGGGSLVLLPIIVPFYGLIVVSSIFTIIMSLRSRNRIYAIVFGIFAVIAALLWGIVTKS